MIFDRLFGSWKRRSLGNPSSDLYQALTGELGPVAAGVMVNERNALSLSGFFAAVRAIAEDVGKVPLILYRREGDAKSRAADHPLYDILHSRPSPDYGSMTFRETLIHHAIGWGNGYAFIVRRGRSPQVDRLNILDPSRMRVERGSDGSVWYIYAPERGGEYTLAADDVFHLHGLGFDGLTGYSVVKLARESIGAGLAETQWAGAFFGNSSQPMGYLSVPARLKDGGVNLKKQWESAHKGAKQAFKTAVLEEGTEFKPISVSNVDAQWIESRRFSVVEMCRWLRIPPHKLGDLERATFSNIEQQSIEYVGDTLLPWMRRIEEEISRKLIDPRQNDLFAEHLVDGLLRGDTLSRYQAYAVGRQWGWFSANDVLSMENRNPIGEAGDVYLVPVNMSDAEKLLEPPEPPPPPPEPEAPDDDAAAVLKGIVAEKSLRGEQKPQELLLRLVAAHQGILQNTYERILRVEADKVERAARRAEFATWLDEFYVGHRQHVANYLGETVGAIFRAAWAIWGRGECPSCDDCVRIMAVRHCEASQAADLTAEIARQTALDEWRTTRAEESASREILNIAANIITAFAGVKQNEYGG